MWWLSRDSTQLGGRPADNRSVFLKVDVGNGRAGVWWEDSACVDIPKAVNDASDTIEFMGLYVHCSDSYEAKDVKAVEQVGFMLLHSLFIWQGCVIIFFYDLTKKARTVKS